MTEEVKTENNHAVDIQTLVLSLKELDDVLLNVTTKTIIILRRKEMVFSPDGAAITRESNTTLSFVSEDKARAAHGEITRALMNAAQNNQFNAVARIHY